MRWIIPALLALLIAFSAADRVAAQDPPATSDTTSLYATTTGQLRGRTIPDSVFTMTHLRSLSIAGMECDYRIIDEEGRDNTPCWMLDAIPPEIGELKDLEELALPLNAIRVIPVELGKLKKLRALDLTDNSSLTDIDAITLLDNLEELSLCGCGLRALPKDLGRLTHLKSLCLAGNPIGKSERRRIRRELPGCRVVF